MTDRDLKGALLTDGENSIVFQPWGPSVSINKCDGPVAQESGGFRLVIEMQSGDEIELVARQFDMPPT